MAWARMLYWELFAVALVHFVVPVVWLFIASPKSPGDLYTSPGSRSPIDGCGRTFTASSPTNPASSGAGCATPGIYSVLGAVLTTLVSAMCGYALAVFRFRGRRVLFAALVASLLIPATVIAQPIYLMLVHFGLNNTKVGVALPSLVYPFGVMLCYVTPLGAVPTQVLELARIDGAGEVRTFFTIAMPLMRTGLTTVLTFAFIGSWNC